MSRADLAAVRDAVAYIEDSTEARTLGAGPIGLGLEGVLGSVLGGPLGGVGLVGAGLAAGLVRAGQLKRALRSLAEALDEAAANDETLRTALESNKPVIERRASATALRALRTGRDGLSATPV